MYCDKEQPMHQVNLNDQIYQEARRRAEAAGFSSVDEYIADVLAQDFHADDENLDHFFTPERLTLIDDAAADAAAGNVHTMEQVRESLARTRDAWLRDHGSAK
jgi:hypothetical protein